MLQCNTIIHISYISTKSSVYSFLAHSLLYSSPFSNQHLTNMSDPVSVGGIILMGIKSASLTSLVSIGVLFMVLCCLIELYDDFYSSVVQPSLDFLSVRWKCYSAKKTNSQVRKMILNPRSKDEDRDHQDTKWILREEVEMVIKRLGLSWEPNCDMKLPEIFTSHDIANMFNANEPSLGEVKQAFDLFDENSDGYIDQNELARVLKRLGLKEFSDTECRKMIKIYDRNGDGLIDFSEFCEIVKDSFC